jgi:glycerol-3-phosphate dehydrogenase subunit C
MCVNYCGSFPDLFRAHRQASTPATPRAPRRSTTDDIKASRPVLAVQALLHQVPVHADEGANELLDFPRLMARGARGPARRDGIPVVDRILGEPQRIGALGAGPMAPLSNFVLASRLVRKVQEKVTGISAEFPLPPMARETFGAWLGAPQDRKRPHREAGERGEVVLFATCYGEYNTPRWRAPPCSSSSTTAFACLSRARGGRSPRRGPHLLRHAEPRRRRPGGYAKKIEHNVALLLPHVRAAGRSSCPAPRAAT